MPEHYIPLRSSELLELLCEDGELSDDDRSSLRHFAQLLSAHYQIEHVRLLEKVKATYAPFDPDSDTKALTRWRSDERQQKQNELFLRFAALMEQADYRHLSRTDLEPAMHSCSEWGLVTDVDFRLFERLAIFVRGSKVEQRPHRRAGKLWRREVVSVELYPRVVMVLKLRQHERLPHGIDTAKVYLQLFKDIPKLDVKMLLPGARVRFSKLDRTKIGFPILSGLLMAGWKLVSNVADEFINMVLLGQPAAWWAIATGTAGYGVRTYYGYHQTKQRYSLSLTQVLYFQNLDTNAGVLFRLFDEAHEQTCSEVLLAYYFLWRKAGTEGWTRARLDEAIEKTLEKSAGVKVDFDIAQTLAQLAKLGLLEQAEDCYRVPSIGEALEAVEAAMANVFHAEKPGRSTIQSLKLPNDDFYI